MCCQRYVLAWHLQRALAMGTRLGLDCDCPCAVAHWHELNLRPARQYCHAQACTSAHLAK